MQVHGMFGNAGVDPPPTLLLSYASVDPLRERPGTAVDGHDRDVVRYVIPEADYEHAVVGLSASRVNDERTVERSLNPCEREGINRCLLKIPRYGGCEICVSAGRSGRELQ